MHSWSSIAAAIEELLMTVECSQKQQDVHDLPDSPPSLSMGFLGA